MVEAVKGDGLIGLEGLLSELKVLINDKASGTGAAFALLANVMPPPLLPCLLERMMLPRYYFSRSLGDLVTKICVKAATWWHVFVQVLTEVCSQAAARCLQIGILYFFVIGQMSSAMCVNTVLFAGQGEGPVAIVVVQIFAPTDGRHTNF